MGENKEINKKIYHPIKKEEEEKCKDCIAHDYDEELGNVCMSPICIKESDYDPETRTWVHKAEKKKGGCYQFVYCGECLAFPLGLGCKKPEAVSEKVVFNDPTGIKHNWDVMGSGSINDQYEFNSEEKWEEKKKKKKA